MPWVHLLIPKMCVFVAMIFRGLPAHPRSHRWWQIKSRICVNFTTNVDDDRWQNKTENKIVCFEIESYISCCCFIVMFFFVPSEGKSVVCRYIQLARIWDWWIFYRLHYFTAPRMNWIFERLQIGMIDSTHIRIFFLRNILGVRLFPLLQLVLHHRYFVLWSTQLPEQHFIHFQQFIMAYLQCVKMFE